MQYKFQLKGMTCSSCESTVQAKLKNILGVNVVVADRVDQSVTIQSDSPVFLSDVRAALVESPKYEASSFVIPSSTEIKSVAEKSWLATYKPILIIFAFITCVALLTAFHDGIFSLQHLSGKMFLHNFMTGFFLVFSFFKLLDVSAFTISFSMYDIVAKRIKIYGFLYPFIELFFGIACLIHFQLPIIYMAEIIIMSMGLVGVLQSIFSKTVIKCVCLGNVFDLPMSTVTVIENSLMIVFGTLLLFL
jgi:copper chaperone CopZ